MAHLVTLPAQKDYYRVEPTPHSYYCNSHSTAHRGHDTAQQLQDVAPERI